MTTQLQQAAMCKALKYIEFGCVGLAAEKDTIESLKAALAQQGEPVAWLCYHSRAEEQLSVQLEEPEPWELKKAFDSDVIWTKPLYAAAPAPQEPVLGTKTWFDGEKLITQNLTASDIYAEPAPQAQKPSGYIDMHGFLHPVSQYREGYTWAPLYKGAQPVQPVQVANQLANAVLDLMTPEGGDVSDIGAQPVAAQACNQLCELCVKRGYDFCANVAKTTTLTLQSTQPVEAQDWKKEPDSVPPLVKWAREYPDVADIIAGALHVSRGTAYDLMRTALQSTQPAQPLRELSDEEIEEVRKATFSTNNPYCPVDSKSMRKAARAVLKKASE